QQVIEEGLTHATVNPDNPGSGIPGFIIHGPFYEIISDAVFEGEIEICISYDDTGMPLEKELALTLFHMKQGNDWGKVDSNVNKDTNVICGTITDLSWFTLAYEENTPPTVTITGPDSYSIHAVDTEVTFTGTFTDDNTWDEHTAVWTFKSMNSEITLVGTVTESEGGGSVTDTYSFAEAGIYSVTLTITDVGGLDDTTSYTVDNLPAMVVIYDPNGGFVTGGGWIYSPAGAYVADPTLEGKASFGFVAKFKKGSSTPIGNTEFQFHVADLNFHSSNYEWLVIAGARAQFKGTGTINGEGEYKFILTAIDGDINGGGGVDKFRIKIWEEDESGVENVIYDNDVNSGADVTDDDSEHLTEIAGGAIVIHKAKN
ncbi:MAG: hypothetical protein JSV56_10310, partial [Methanomassiliicoccales archaeon]